AVAVRGRLPLLALAAATAGQVVHLGFTPFLDNAVDVAPALALYTVAAHTGRRAVSIIAAAAAAAAVALALLAEPSRAYQVSSPLLRQWPVLLLAAAWLVGEMVRARRLYAEEAQARARDLRQHQEREAESLVAAERTRIAREMHDVVAHGLSVIVIQAQAAAQAMEREPAGAGGAPGGRPRGPRRDGGRGARGAGRDAPAVRPRRGRRPGAAGPAGAAARALRPARPGGPGAGGRAAGHARDRAGRAGTGAR